MKLLLALALFVPVFAQDPPPAERPKPARPEPKNLQVLKVPGSEIMGIMRSVAAGLGVQCAFCHVQGNFAADDNPHKGTARQMFAMSMKINEGFGDGKMHVTCFTCHRGETTPKMAPAPATPGDQKK